MRRFSRLAGHSLRAQCLQAGQAPVQRLFLPLKLLSYLQNGVSTSTRSRQNSTPVQTEHGDFLGLLSPHKPSQESKDEAKPRAYVSKGRPRRVFPVPSRNPSARPPYLPPKIEDGKLLAYDPKFEEFVPVSSIWLRDHCGCNECVHPHTRQRQISVFRDVIDTNVTECFHITVADGHRSTFHEDFITRSVAAKARDSLMNFEHPRLWTSRIAISPPTVEYTGFGETRELRPFMHNLRKWGFCFVSGLPPTPEATKEFLESIGPIRNTHYGGFYDFTSDLSSKDTAYTNLGLEAHTDTTYFSDPAGLQAFHMLSHEDGSGGESLLVDGFAAAGRLYRNDMSAYETLSTTGVSYHASGNDGVSIQPYATFPVLQHHPRGGQLMQVRWNNADRAGLARTHKNLDEWYRAAGKFDQYLNDGKNQYWFQLQPGKLLIFDNWRVLHGRAAFTGKRRMCGAYINRDDYISRFKMEVLGEQAVRDTVVTG